MHFQHSADIWRDFPALVPGVLYTEGITSYTEGITSYTEGITGHANAEARADRFTAIAKARLAVGPEAELPEIQAWRRAFARMGLKPTQYRCAAESLLRRFRKEGSLPRLHPLVDLCNAVSLAFAIPVAVFDATAVAWPLEVRYAVGDEDYLTFGGDTEHPAVGEVIFADQAGQAHARRWTNRQSGRSAVRDATAAVLVVAEALHDEAASDVRELTATLAAEIAAIWPVSPQSAVLTPAEPRFTWSTPMITKTFESGETVNPSRSLNPPRQPRAASVTPGRDRLAQGGERHDRAATGSDPASASRANSASWTGFGCPARPR